MGIEVTGADLGGRDEHSFGRGRGQNEVAGRGGIGGKRDVDSEGPSLEEEGGGSRECDKDSYVPHHGMASCL